MAMMSSNRSGFEPHQQVAHAGAFQLEHARRFTGGEQLERRLIVEGQLFDPQRRLVGAALVDERLGPLNHRQGLQTEKVEFHQADFSTSPMEYWVTISSLGPCKAGHVP